MSSWRRKIYKESVMKPIKILPSKIKANTFLKAGTIYIVRGEVRVLKNVRLTIQDQVEILVVNGVVKNSCLKRSSLIFDQGSQLSAKRVSIKACNQYFKLEKLADNGGIWFLGGYANASKDGISVKVDRKNPLSRFTAALISTSYLGRADSSLNPKTGRTISIRDDIDGISILGVGVSEWAIQAVRSNYSADDGIDFTNSHVRLSRLEVNHPTEDGINASSSRIEIHRSLRLNVPKSKVLDRDLFDLEVDDGASYIELHKGCSLKLKGVFGDQVELSSTQMPKPNIKVDNEVVYKYEGRLKQAALIYSINKD